MSWTMNRTKTDVEIVSDGQVIAHAWGEDDARLIAAAPELLEALEQEHEALGCETDVTNEPCSTCQVIAKAKGLTLPIAR